MKKILSYVATLAAIAFVAFGANTATAGAYDYKGSFTGKSNHVVTGDVTIEKQSNGSYIVILEENFVLDGAPDPSVGFGKDGQYVEGTYLGNLTKNKGKQTFALPANINLSDYNEVYIWCAEFTVPLGVATIK
jgi:hypothetical protein